MQVKVCPKCKAENRPTNAACSSCYTSLEKVPITESTAPPAPARTQAVPAAPRPPRPTTSPAPTQQMPAPQQTQMGTLPPPPPGMPPGAFQMAPVRHGPSPGVVGLIIFLAVAVIGGGLFFAASKGGLFKGAPMPTEPPEKAILGFLAAKQTHDMSKVGPFLSSHSIEMMQKAFSGAQAQSAGFGQKDSEDMYVWNATPSIEDMKGRSIVASLVKDDEYTEDRTAVVMVTLDKKAVPSQPKPLVAPGTAPPPTDQSPEKKIDISDLFDTGPIHAYFVMIAEDGRWKVDFAQTTNRGLGLGKVKNPFKLGK